MRLVVVFPIIRPLDFGFYPRVPFEQIQQVTAIYYSPSETKILGEMLYPIMLYMVFRNFYRDQ